MRFDGIDPGATGALCVVGDDGRTVLDLQSWRRSARPPVLRVLPGDIVALEQQYVGKSARGSLSLATWCGLVLAQLDECQVIRPLASSWRGKVLRSSNMRRDAAKAAAIDAATKHAIGGPDVWTDDEAEAWCMARYSWGWWRAQQQRRARD